MVLGMIRGPSGLARTSAQRKTELSLSVQKKSMEENNAKMIFQVTKGPSNHGPTAGASQILT